MTRFEKKSIITVLCTEDGTVANVTALSTMDKVRHNIFDNQKYFKERGCKNVIMFSRYMLINEGVVGSSSELYISFNPHHDVLDISTIASQASVLPPTFGADALRAGDIILVGHPTVGDLPEQNNVIRMTIMNFKKNNWGNKTNLLAKTAASAFNFNEFVVLYYIELSLVDKDALKISLDEVLS